jgi:hypothetical protein
MNSANASITVAALVLASLGATSLAQRLPDAPPPQRNVGPVRVPNLEQFVDSYRRSGSPKLLVVTDVVGQAAGTAASLNSQAMATRLSSRLQDCFRHPEVFIVSGGASKLKQQAETDALRRQDELGAASLLGKEAGAELVVYVRMIEQTGRNDGVRYTGSYVVADLRRGQSIGSFAWDMYQDPGTGEFDAVRMGDYAYVIASRVANDVIDSFPVVAQAQSLRTFTIRVVGDYQDDDLKGFRDALRTMVSVKPDSVRLTREESTAESKLSTFDLMYAGELIDIRSDIRHAAIDKLFMDASILSSTDSNITLRLNAIQLSDRERMLAGGEDNARNREERAQLAARYAKAGSPSLAVVINRVAVADETAANTAAAAVPAQQGDGTNIIVGNRVDLAGGKTAEELVAKIFETEIKDRRIERREDALLDVGMFEARLAQRLLQLKLNVVDVAAAQTKIFSQPSAAERTWNDRAYAHELATAAGAKVVLSGTGKLVRDRLSGRPSRVSFTLVALEVESSRTLGAVSVYRDINGGDQNFNETIDALVAEATGKIVTAMSDGWGK